MLRNNGLYSIDIIGVFGKTTYRRTNLRPADEESKRKLFELEGVKGIYPLDSMLGIDKLPFKITCEMMCLIALEGITNTSYKEASGSILEHYHFSISDTQVEHVTDFVGACVLEEQRRLAQEAEKAAGIAHNEKRRRLRKNDIAYYELDGAMAHLRDKNGKDAWAESKHAIVFHSERIKYYENKNKNSKDDKNGKDKEPRHKILNKEYIGYIGSNKEFKYHFLALAMRNQYDLCTEVVVLSDGAPWIHSLVDEFFPKYIHIIDLFHTKSTVGKFAKAVIRGKNKASAFADEICNLLENSEIDKALERLEKYKDKKLPDGIPNAYTYIKNHRDQMDYLLYKKLGYFVGSGAIESANRQLLERMKGPGKRWNTETAQGVLTLITKLLSDKWGDVLRIVHKKVYGSDYKALYTKIEK